MKKNYDLRFTNYDLHINPKYKLYAFLEFSNSQILKFLIILFVILPSSIVISQDIHFSQYYSSPLNLNPALSGAFDGECRITAIERSQWYTVTTPYQTFGASIEAAQIKKLKNFGIGFSAYSDKTGDSHFSTLALNLSLSYILKLNADSTHLLSLGIQSGVTQRKLDYTNLSFNSQYNGFYYDPSLSSQEILARQSRLYPNLNAGLNHLLVFSEKMQLTSGISLYNINKAKQSFYTNNSIRLDSRISFHSAFTYQLNQQFTLVPSLLFMSQGSYNEFDLGGTVKYALINAAYMYRALYAGIWTRAKDAGFIVLGMEYDNWNVGISYDLNYSNLSPASNAHGGFEVSLIYIIRKQLKNKSKQRICPEII